MLTAFREVSVKERGMVFVRLSFQSFKTLLQLLIICGSKRPAYVSGSALLYGGDMHLICVPSYGRGHEAMLRFVRPSVRLFSFLILSSSLDGNMRASPFHFFTN